jgi:uncharacterized membrane protein
MRPNLTHHFSTRRRDLPSIGKWFLLVLLLVFAIPQPAQADLRLCNETGNQIGVAIGYKSATNWTTEGWWNLAQNTCKTLIPGELNSRYYYIYALDYDEGGVWGGPAFMCTDSKQFTILGIENCVARGFERRGFYEVDTQKQENWTVQLTEKDQREPN